METAKEAVAEILANGVDAAMNAFNGKKPAQTGDEALKGGE